MACELYIIKYLVFEFVDWPLPNVEKTKRHEFAYFH